MIESESLKLYNKENISIDGSNSSDTKEVSHDDNL